tara:strand:+ start:656 stop:1081 length:426 start_codon:yes stop_codon:yes gene_type:complete
MRTIGLIFLPFLFLFLNFSALVLAQEIVNLDVDHILVEHKKNNPHIDKSFSVVRTTICGADGSIKKNVFDTDIRVRVNGKKLSLTEDGHTTHFKVDKTFETYGSYWIIFGNSEISFTGNRMYMRCEYKTDFGVVKIYNVYE